MDTDLMFSSKSSEWSTPQDIYDKLHAVYQFELDPASTMDNKKCNLNYTLASNGLLHNWDQTTFVNPPYGRGASGKWTQKAYAEHLKHGTTVVMLLPSRTCTTWFHEYCSKANVICFIKGRLKFSNSIIEKEWEDQIAAGVKTQEQFMREYPSPAPFPSMLCIFTKFTTPEQMEVLMSLGSVVTMVNRTDQISTPPQKIGSLENELAARQGDMDQVADRIAKRASDMLAEVMWREVPDC